MSPAGKLQGAAGTHVEGAAVGAAPRQTQRAAVDVDGAAVVEGGLHGGGAGAAALGEGAGVVEGGSAGVVIEDDIDLDVEGGPQLVVEHRPILEVNPPCTGHVGGAVVGDGTPVQGLGAGAADVQGATDGEGARTRDLPAAPVEGAVDRQVAAAVQRSPAEVHHAVGVDGARNGKTEGLTTVDQRLCPAGPAQRQAPDPGVHIQRDGVGASYVNTDVVAWTWN